MKWNNILALVILSACTLVATAQGGADPAGLENNNFFKNPGFNEKPCTTGWNIETVQVACNGGAGFVWLNHNNRAGDPAVNQKVTGLVPGMKYQIVVGWRGGDHGPAHGVKGARNIFAIDLDGKELVRLTTGANYTNWMVNDQPEGTKVYSPIEFTATGASHVIRFRGEVGADGDVLLGWVKLTGQEKEMEKVDTPKTKGELPAHIKMGAEFGGGIICKIDKVNRTVLIAAKKDLPQSNWTRATRLCDEYTSGGFSDWRLPTLKELRRLYVKEDMLQIPHDHYYWSSKVHDDHGNIWVKGFMTGEEDFFSKRLPHHVRAVRSSGF